MHSEAIEMLARLRGRDRALLGVSVLILAVAVSVRGSIWLDGAVRARTDLLNHRAALLFQEQALVKDVAAIAEVERRASAVRASAEARRFHALDAMSAQQGAASYIEQVAEASAVTLQGPPEVSAGAGTSLSLRARTAAISDFRGLLTFLHRLEHGPLTFRILALDVTQVAPDEHVQEELHVSLTLIAFWLPTP